MRLRLPWPPSINMYYRMLRNLTCQRCGHKTKLPPPYITKEGREFRKAVARIAITEKKLGTEKLAIRVDYYPPAARGDIDNYMKPLLDALEHSGLFENDAQVKDLRLVWHHPVMGGAVNVKIWEIDNVSD